MMGLDTPETCRGWRNILRVSCASSWVFFTQGINIHWPATQEAKHPATLPLHEQLTRTPTQSAFQHNNSSDATILAQFVQIKPCALLGGVCVPAAGEGHIVNYWRHTNIVHRVNSAAAGRKEMPDVDQESVKCFWNIHQPAILVATVL